MEPIVFFATKAFWKDAAERSVSTAAEAALAAIGVDALSAFDLDYKHLAGLSLAGALLSLLKAFAVAGHAQAKSGGDVE